MSSYIGITIRPVLPLFVCTIRTIAGYWCGGEDHVTHYSLHDNFTSAYDFVRDQESAFEFSGHFSTPVFTNRAIEIIRGVDPASDERLFLYLAFQVGRV